MSSATLPVAPWNIGIPSPQQAPGGYSSTRPARRLMARTRLAVSATSTQSTRISAPRPRPFGRRRGLSSTRSKTWCFLSTATRRRRRNRCRSGPQLQCLANGESSPEGESRRRSDSQAAALSRELVSCGTTALSHRASTAIIRSDGTLSGACSGSRATRDTTSTPARVCCLSFTSSRVDERSLRRLQVNDAEFTSMAWFAQHSWKNLGSCDVQTLRDVAINAPGSRHTSNRS